jgi:CO/xanthine dehydrogenase FAD-binding subunit
MALDEIAQLDALSDVHYSGEYRKRIAQALVKRALKTAYDDAIQRSCRP